MGRNSARISEPTTSGCRIELVPSKGLEPPHPCGYMDLNHARLPIPPRWPGYDCGSFRHFGRSGSDRRTTKPASRKELHPYSTEASLAVKPTTLKQVHESTKGVSKKTGDRTFVYLSALCGYEIRFRRVRGLTSEVRPSLPCQLRVHRDLRIQHFRYRASLLRRFRILLKGRRIGTRNLSHDVNVARCDRPSRIQILHRQCHACRNALRSQVCPAQLPRKRHGKASCMRRRNQFFR